MYTKLSLNKSLFIYLRLCNINTYVYYKKNTRTHGLHSFGLFSLKGMDTGVNLSFFVQF